MTTRTSWARTLCGVLALTALGLASGGHAGAQPQPYEIDVVLPLTGPGAFIGATETATLGIVEKQIDAAGGVHGRPVKFVTFDDASSPQTDVQLTSALIAKHVAVIFDGGPLATCRAVAPLVAQNGPVLYCLSPALYPAAGSYVFSTSASSEDESHALINFFHVKHWKRVAIMTPTDATGQEADRVFHDLFALPENRDLTIVDYEHFSPSDISVAAQMSKIKDAHPDVMMAWGTGTPTATEYRGLKDAGIDVPVVGANGNQQYALMEQWASILPDQYYQYSMKWPAYRTIGNGPVKDAMLKMYAAFAAAGIRPDSGASLVWDPAMIVVTALNTLPDSPSPQQLRDAILQLHGFAGINGFYDFRVGNQRGLTIKDCIVVQWDRATKTFVPVSGSAGKAS
jgi:branched-chain amino acid transport system substrate-binding protein